MSKNTSHSPVKLRRVPYQICRKCGLIYLKNERTAKAIRKPCPGTPDES